MARPFSSEMRLVVTSTALNLLISSPERTLNATESITLACWWHGGGWLNESSAGPGSYVGDIGRSTTEPTGPGSYVGDTGRVILWRLAWAAPS